MYLSAPFSSERSDRLSRGGERMLRILKPVVERRAGKRLKLDCAFREERRDFYHKQVMEASVQLRSFGSDSISVGEDKNT